MTCKIPRPDIPHILVSQVNKSIDYPPKLKLIGRGQSDSWLSMKNFRIIRGMRPTFLSFYFFCVFPTANEIKSDPNWHSLFDVRTVKICKFIFGKIRDGLGSSYRWIRWWRLWRLQLEKSPESFAIIFNVRLDEVIRYIVDIWNVRRLWPTQGNDIPFCWVIFRIGHLRFIVRIDETLMGSNDATDRLALSLKLIVSISCPFSEIMWCRLQR